MSEFSFMEKLLDGVEVEWPALGEVANYEQPTNISSRQPTIEKILKHLF